MKKTVATAAKLGGQMVKGVAPFDAAKAAKAMNDINAVPDKYVTLFPKGTEHGAIKDSEALRKIWVDFDNFKALAMKLKDTSAKAAGAAEQGKGTFTAAFNEMTKVCKEYHETYREKLEQWTPTAWSPKWALPFREESCAKHGGGRCSPWPWLERSSSIC